MAFGEEIKAQSDSVLSHFFLEMTPKVAEIQLGRRGVAPPTWESRRNIEPSENPKAGPFSVVLLCSDTRHWACVCMVKGLHRTSSLSWGADEIKPHKI